MQFEVKNGSFSYHNSTRTILKNVNFDISSGEILCVLGSNGVGKTTLLKCMMGLQKWNSGETLRTSVYRAVDALNNGVWSALLALLLWQLFKPYKEATHLTQKV